MTTKWTEYNNLLNMFGNVWQFKGVHLACYRAYIIVHVLNIWRQILFLANLHDAAL